ncbi:hypothetical protein C8Q80DRAFT_1304396 [Daedaleopsis nitida]|nr:hypothetical protein C8Q80DRAFT_1304396 [Daedaleopsis nitida]
MTLKRKSSDAGSTVHWSSVSHVPKKFGPQASMSSAYSVSISARHHIGWISPIPCHGISPIESLVLRASGICINLVLYDVGGNGRQNAVKETPEEQTPDIGRCTTMPEQARTASERTMDIPPAIYAQLFATLIDETYYTLSAFTLLAFEFIITFDREVRLVWRGKVTGATILFVLNRYWLFFQYITQMVTMYPMSQRVTFCPSSCEAVGTMVMVGNGGPPVIWAAFSVLRAYALCSRKWWIIPLVSVFFLPDIILTSIYFTSLKPEQLPPPFNCVLSSSLPQSEWAKSVSVRVCLIVGDLVVLIITWYTTYGIRKAAAGIKVRTSLTDSLLKDGTVYFGCLLVLNVVNILANVLSESSAVSAFQDPITCILVSRFLLNLRDTANNRADGDMSSIGDPSFVAQPRGRDRGTSTSLQFAEFVDPMGAALDHGVGGLTSAQSSLTFATGSAGWDDDDSERGVGMGMGVGWGSREDANELRALQTARGGEDAKAKAEEGGINLVESPVSSNETSDGGASRAFEIECLVRPLSDTRGWTC